MNFYLCQFNYHFPHRCWWQVVPSFGPESADRLVCLSLNLGTVSLFWKRLTRLTRFQRNKSEFSYKTAEENLKGKYGRRTNHENGWIRLNQKPQNGYTQTRFSNYIIDFPQTAKSWLYPSQSWPYPCQFYGPNVFLYDPLKLRSFNCLTKPRNESESYNKLLYYITCWIIISFAIRNMHINIICFTNRKIQLRRVWLMYDGNLYW